MSTHGGRLACALAALSLSGALAACTGGGGASATSTALPTPSMTYYTSTTAAPTSTPPTTTATTSAAPTAGIAPPVMPAAAKAHTPDGAAVFARYYMDLINYAYMKPDPRPLRALTKGTCHSCEKYAKYADQLSTANVRADAPPYIFERSDPADTLPSGEQVVTVIGHDGAYRFVGNGQADPSPATAGPRSAAEMYLQYENGHWSVAALEKVE